MDNTKKKIQKRQLSGTILSIKMDKSIVVRVINNKVHPIYKRVVKQYRKYLAHNEMEGLEVGDKVRIIETRPMSRKKRWTVAEKA